MATIREFIEHIDEMKPNAFPEKVKLRWIALLDGKVAAGVYRMDIADVRRLEYTYPECMEHKPLIEFPYDDLYDLWLSAMIDFQNGEYNKYQNEMEMFNSRYYEFVHWIADAYDPAQGG